MVTSRTAGSALLKALPELPPTAFPKDSTPQGPSLCNVLNTIPIHILLRHLLYGWQVTVCLIS